jgi:hypothetical protein
LSFESKTFAVGISGFTLRLSSVGLRLCFFVEFYSLACPLRLVGQVVFVEELVFVESGRTPTS